MKKKSIAAMLAMLTMTLSLASGCGRSSSSSASSTDTASSSGWEKVESTEAASEAETADAAGTEEEEADDPNTYKSELNGMPESNDLQDTRPIAVMIDNDPRALPHYGLADAEIVYEMMNSTANDRVTRLMALYKDWSNIDQIGNIRSTRSTNIMLDAEWNAILIHDGGPFYIDAYLQSTGIPHLSGKFSRVNNGKATEFTEYIMGDEVVKRAESAGYKTTYTDEQQHFTFGTPDMSGASDATTINLNCFQKTTPSLKYNESTGTYDYYEQGELTKDGEDGETVSFKNIILQNSTFTQLDQNGYLVYNIVGQGSGWYITEGKAKEITWSKASETAVTHFYDTDGNEIVLNPGKIYIAICPDDGWKDVGIQ